MNRGNQVAEKYVNLPTYFEQMEDDSDSRFKKVKIYVAHTGLNLNNSIFSKEVLAKLAQTLQYIPILGRIGVNKDDKPDFRGHEVKVIWDEDTNDVTTKYGTYAYGFVSEQPNAAFEIVGGKEWLVCEGYLWTRFDEAMDIFKEADGSKGQSMEIINVSYEVDKQGRVVYTDGEFAGLCILGDDVTPAMTGSTISTNFAKDSIKELVSEMLNEFTVEKGAQTLATKKEKKDENVKVAEGVTKQDVKSEPTKSEQDVKSEPKEVSKEEPKTDVSHETEDKGKEESVEASSAGNDSAEHEANESTDDKSAAMSADEENKADKEETAETEPTEENEQDDFSVNLTKVRKNLDCAVEKAFENEGHYAWVVDWNDTDFVCKTTDGEKSKHYKATYSYDDNGDVVLGNMTEVIPTYLTKEEFNKVEKDRAEMEALKARLAELESYAKTEESKKKQAILDENKGDLSKEVYESFQNNFSDMTAEELEKEIAFAIFQANKNQKEKTPKPQVVTTNFSTEKNYGFGELDKYFTK